MKYELSNNCHRHPAEQGLHPGPIYALDSTEGKTDDVNPQKFKDIDSLSLSVGEAKAYRELYQLPGIKATRAELYYKAGYTNLFEIASATAEEIIEKTSQVIAAESSNNKAPLLKEARTHVAVARAFTSSI